MFSTDNFSFITKKFLIVVHTANYVREQPKQSLTCRVPLNPPLSPSGGPHTPSPP